MDFIYKQYDQASLDKQYNNRLHVPDYADYFNRWERLSRQTEEQLQVIKDVSYGSGPRETLDIYPSGVANAKVLVFIHGGYWHMLDKNLFAFIANGFHSYGITVVLLNYPLAPDASMDQIVSSCRKAIGWIYQNISAYNGNPGQLYIAGHSAGGHLAAMLLTTNWAEYDASLQNNPFRGALFISGLFNLVPIKQSFLNQVLQLDEAAVLANSPVRFNPPPGVPIVVAVGAAETSEFNDHSKELYEAWKGNETDIELLQVPELNHFSIIESLAEKNSALHLALIRLLGIEF